MARESIAIDASNSEQASRLSFDQSVETLSANRTISNSELEQFNGFAFDPAGARDLTLPAEAQANGAILFISNEANAAEIITIKNDGGTTICTPTQNEAAILWCDGTNWYGGVVTTS
ncbi:MAG: hypothetical protein GTO41_16035 [Burkholderiales bacterium]|nr:hypothetical protein [Burkholderiales bacterium]